MKVLVVFEVDADDTAHPDVIPAAVVALRDDVLGRLDGVPADVVTVHLAIREAADQVLAVFGSARP